MKVYVQKSGAYVSFEKLTPRGMYLVKLYNAAGSLLDKVRCDDYRNARSYVKSFILIARNN